MDSWESQLFLKSPLTKEYISDRVLKYIWKEDIKNSAGRNPIIDIDISVINDICGKQSEDNLRRILDNAGIKHYETKCKLCKKIFVTNYSRCNGYLGLDIEKLTSFSPKVIYCPSCALVICRLKAQKKKESQKISCDDPHHDFLEFFYGQSESFLGPGSGDIYSDIRKEYRKVADDRAEYDCEICGEGYYPYEYDDWDHDDPYIVYRMEDSDDRYTYCQECCADAIDNEELNVDILIARLTLWNDADDPIKFIEYWEKKDEQSFLTALTFWQRKRKDYINHRKVEEKKKQEEIVTKLQEIIKK